MGVRGPAPKPTKLRLLEGTHLERVNLREPIAPTELPEPPEDISPDVLKVWDYTVAQLSHMGIVSTADRDALFCYCQAVVSHRQASAILARTPVLIKGALGGMVRNPALAVARDSAYTIRQFAQEFGLTPSARTRVESARAGDSGEADNPFAGTG
jgi:P27 family predicted phage terminase small subunit